MTNKKDDFTNLNPQERRELEKLLGIDQGVNQDKKENDLGLLSFLQEESIRLKKLAQFGLNQAPIIDEFPQAERISTEQQILCIELKNKIIEILQRPSSEFHRNMNDLFKRQFGQIGVEQSNEE